MKKLMLEITREEALSRLHKAKERKKENARVHAAFLRGMHYAETGELLDENAYIVW